MSLTSNFSRRSFLAAAGAASAASAFGQKKKVPIGLELYSLRNEFAKDDVAVVRETAKMGYDGVEFYGPYFNWTTEKAKEMRKVLDEVGLKCYSTHNGAASFDPANYQKAIDLNSILGSKIIVQASAGRKITGIDDWKLVAEALSKGAEAFKKAGIRAGYHNHKSEFVAVDGTLPMQVLAKNTPKDVVLQLDVGTCVEAGADPVKWINDNPGRIRSIHCKEWSSEAGKGFRVLFGQGNAPWKEIFKAAESKGGIEAYLIEQEGADVTPYEAAKLCLDAIKKMRG